MAYHVLKHSTSEHHTYDPQVVLPFWHLLQARRLVPTGYLEEAQPARYTYTDEDRVVGLFELLDGSQLCDLFFSSHADGDQSSELSIREDDD